MFFTTDKNTIFKLPYTIKYDIISVIKCEPGLNLLKVLAFSKGNIFKCMLTFYLLVNFTNCNCKLGHFTQWSILLLL